MKSESKPNINPHAVPYWHVVFVVGVLTLLLVMITPTAVASETRYQLDSKEEANQAQLLPLDLKHYRGKVVVAEFWGSWCYQCAHSVAWLNGLSSRYAGDLAVVGVNLDSDRKKALSFQSKYPARFSTVYDPQWQHASYYQVKHVPTLMIFNRKGKLLFQHQGFKSSEKEDYETLIEAVILMAN